MTLLFLLSRVDESRAVRLLDHGRVTLSGNFRGREAEVVADYRRG